MSAENVKQLSMKRKNDIQQTAKRTEKQYVILRLRLAMATSHYDVIPSLAEELKTINTIKL